MPEFFKKRIVKLLSHADYTPLKPAQLAKILGVSSVDYPQFKLAFERLREAGDVVIGGGDFVSLPPMLSQIIGTFRANPGGFGFVRPLEPNTHGDLFIPAEQTAGAMTGDVVVAKVVKKGKRAGGPRTAGAVKGVWVLRYSGKVIEILQRAENKFVGTLLKDGGGWIIQPDGRAFVEPVSVDDVGAKNGRHKDKVVFEILSYPTTKDLGKGVIIEVLGKAGRDQSEIKSVIHQYRLPEEFDEDCIKQARESARQFNPEQFDSRGKPVAKQRGQITDKVIITIDPEDAKDFDDAIGLEKDEQGNWVLGVHIADVSSFVKPHSPLDKEAARRGNSVYLPGRTIPMLPKVLSNGICSLQPSQKRFVKSVYLAYDDQGNVLSRRFANSIMNSTQRLSYKEADRILKGHTKGAKPQVVELLKSMERLSRLIEKRRLANGMLHLDLPETEIVMDKSGRVVDAQLADDSYPHTMIEMFMVEANEAVAGLLDQLKASFMRRIHPEPDGLSMKNLSRFVMALGLSIPATADRRALQGLLAAVKGTDRSLGVNLLVLRSLEKAQYSPQRIGHFALSSRHYCHFTSPIRRYADLLVHRVLEDYMQKKPDLSYQDEDLYEIGKHLSFTEQRAEDAERELKDILVLQLLSKHIGDELDGVVAGLAGFGVFVQSRKFGVEGLIRMDDLGPGVWKSDAKTHCIVGKHCGCSIHLGLAMKVRIVSVNVPARQLNVAPVEPLAAGTEQAGRGRVGKRFRKGQARSKNKKR